MAAIIAQHTAIAGLKARRNVTTRASRARVMAVSADARPNYFPGSTPPKHLDGTMPGDYGFDPLGLGEDKEALKWYQQAELVHGRWAMLGVAGMAAPELVHNPLVDGPMPNWFDAPLWDGYAAPVSALAAVQIFLMNWAEVLRWQDMKNPGSVHADPYDNSRKCTGTDVGYPGGGLFNPMGMAKPGSAEEKTLRVKEIANGRLAMVAAMGCIIQQEATGVGCVANLKDHLADPGHANIFANFTPIVF